MTPKIWVFTVWYVFVIITLSLAEDGNLRSEGGFAPRAHLGPRSRISVASTLSSRRRLSGRKLQEKSSSPGLFDGLNQMIGNIPIVGNVAQDFNSLLSGGWRQLGQRLNGGSIPAVGTVLDRLTSGSQIVNGLQFQLREVTSVFNNLPIIGQSFYNTGNRNQASTGATTAFGGSLQSSGIFGVSGLLGSLTSGFSSSFSGFFESALFSRLGFRSPRLFSGLTADVGGAQLSDLNVDAEQKAAGLAEEATRLLGAQIDALTTAFSGGVQLPFIGSLLQVDKSFSLLVGGPGDISLWTKAVTSLQQLREDLIRLPLAWNLDASQESTINSSVGIIDNLLTRIGGQNGVLDFSFFNEVSASLQSLGTSLLGLDGTNLLPKVGLGGLDISSQLSGLVDGVLSVPIDLSKFSFLQDAFGLSRSVLEGALRTPVTLGSNAVDQLSTITNQAFFSDLLARTVGSFPAMLSEAVQLGGMLSSVSDGLLSSLQLSTNLDSSMLGRIGEMLNVGPGSDINAFLGQLFQGDKNPDGSSPSNVIAFVKLLQLDSAMNTVQGLINNLETSTRSVAELLPGFNGLNDLFSGGGITSGASNLFDGLTSLPRELANNLAQGVGRITTQLPGGLDPLNLFKRGRRLQESNSDNEFEIDFEKSDLESLSIFASSAALLNALSVVDVIVEETLSSPCLTQDEVEAMQVVRAAALIGDPVDVMKTTESDATIVDILASSADSSETKPDTITASSPLCEERRKALTALQKYSQDTMTVLSQVVTNSLIDTPEAVQSIITDLESLLCSTDSDVPLPPSSTI